MNKFFLYALFVTVFTTGASWIKMIGSASSPSGGSSWSSHSRGYSGGYSGGSGGHK
jgi:hypothetical protein